MDIIITKDYDAMSRAAADEIASCIKGLDRCVLGLATGSTPEGTYADLVEDFKSGDLSFADVVSFNLDEYVGLNGTHDQSYRYFMDRHLFNHVNIDKSKTHVPNGIAQDIAKECLDYEASIKDAGGIDLQLLGLGHNGHIGFNEPADDFPKSTHMVELSESTINANSRLFASVNDVPHEAITMGIGTIMAARKVLVIASGAGKAEIVARAFSGEVTPDVPASILQFHPNAVVIVDEEAAKCL